MTLYVNDPIVYTAVPSTPGFQASDHRVSWVFDDGTTANGTTVNKTWATIGDHSATATARNLVTGTQGTATKIVAILPVPTPDITSDFTVDADGWTILQDGDLAWNPAGYITADDWSQGQTTKFAAPAKYLGNKLAYQGGWFRWKLRPRSQVDYNANPGIIAIIGGGLQISVNLAVPTQNAWNQYEVKLDATTNWRLGSAWAGDPVATLAQIQTVLADITSIQLCSEFTGIVDHTDLDDVFMGMT